jgi:hypothetical protein
MERTGEDDQEELDEGIKEGRGREGRGCRKQLIGERRGRVKRGVEVTGGIHSGMCVV